MCRSQVEASFCNLDSLEMDDHQIPVRNYRRPMKPILPRKVSSSARINLNKFWNDLEEFYSSFNDRLASNETIKTTVGQLPDYTTDVFNQDREAAENDLNEILERSFCSTNSSNFDCQSSNISSCCDDDDDEEFDSGNEDWDSESTYSSDSSYLSYSSDSSYLSYSSYSSTESIPSCSEAIRPPKTLLPLIKKTWSNILPF